MASILLLNSNLHASDSLSHASRCALPSHGSLHGTSSHSWASFDRSERVDVVVSISIKSAQSSLFMSHKVLVEPVTGTIATVESEDCLEQMHHNSVWLLHLDLLMTLCTGKILGCFIVFSDVSL